jgi:hypothetical protein
VLEDQQNHLAGLDAFGFEAFLRGDSPGEHIPDGNGFVFFSGMLEVDRNLIRPVFVM